MSDVTDETLIREFEAATLAAFPHAAHVRVAWWYLRHSPLPEAMGRFRTGIRRFAEAKGAAGKYHETMTVAWLLLIAERAGDAPDLTWPEFSARYPELLDPALLSRYYRPETLAGERARRAFVMPDRVAHPPVTRVPHE